MEHRPRVSLDTSTGVDSPLDVLQGGSDHEPRLTPLAQRRLLVIAASVAAVCATIAAGVEVQKRLAAAAEERRLGSALQLSVLAEPSSFAAVDPASKVAQLELRLRVHNDGPREVTVLRVRAGDYVLADPVLLASDAAQELVLQRKVQCSSGTAPAVQTHVDPIEITARTAGGMRTIQRSWSGELVDVAARACGHPPLSDAVQVEVLGAAQTPLAELIGVNVHTASVVQIEISSVESGRGLAVELRELDGKSIALPLPLPVPSIGSTAAHQLEVAVSVDDCAAVRWPQAALLTFQLRDSAGETARLDVAYDPAWLRPLLDTWCEKQN